MKKYFVLLIFAMAIIITFSGCSSSGLFSPANNIPVITSTPVTSVSVGMQYTYQVRATDNDDDTLIFSVSTIPDTNMDINSSTGLISWKPTEEGDYSVTVTVSDGKSTDIQSFTITVSLGATTSNRVVMVELFVAPACGLCPSAKASLAQLLGKYGFDKLVVLEEYVVSTPLSGWSIADIYQRYWKGYYEYLSSDETGTPDAYFNGLSHSVHQKDSSPSYATNYEAAIEAELTKSPKVAISASYDVNGSTVNISGRINNISSETLSNIVVEAMIYEDSVSLIVPDKPEYTVNHVVRDIITHDETGGEELIASFAPGDSHQFSLTSSSLSNVHDMSNIHVVVYVQAPNSSTKEILQALYVE